MLRQSTIDPAFDVIEKALKEANNAYMKFIEKLEAHELQLEWNYNKVYKSWMAKGLYRWIGVRGGRKKRTIFWLSIWEGFFKVSIYMPEKAKEEVYSLSLNDKTKKIIQNSKLVGNKYKFFAIVFDLFSEEMYEEVFKILELRKRIK